MKTTDDRPSLSTTKIRGRVNLYAKLFWYAISIFSILLILMSFLDGGLSKAWDSWLTLMVMCTLLGIINAFIWMFPDKPFWILGFLLMLIGGYALYLTGSFNSVSQAAWDGLGIGFGFVCLGLLKLIFEAFQRYHGVNPPKALHSGIGLLCLAISCWIGVSLVTVFRPGTLPVDPARFTSSIHERVIVSSEYLPPSDLKFGIALSGGGYRAAVFHAGTLHALESLGIRFGTLSTVSGGSIIGAYYAIGGDPVEFKDAVGRGEFNLKKDLLLFHNLIRLACPMRVPVYDVELLPFCDFDRIDIQSSMLDRILFEEREHIDQLGTELPRLVINTTELTFGLLIGLLADGIITESPEKRLEVFRNDAYVPDTNFSLSERVAISGAFPGAFPSVGLGVKVKPISSGGGDGTRPFRLADGGIADNTGLITLKNLHAQACETDECSLKYSVDSGWRNDVLFMSDGGAIFGVDNDPGVVSELMRAADIGGIRAKTLSPRVEDIPTIAFSASQRFRGSKTGVEFLAYKDSWGESVSRPGINTSIRFDPRENYPNSVLKKIVSLLPKTKFPNAEALLEKYMSVRGSNKHIDMHQWKNRVSRMSLTDIENCFEKQSLNTELESLTELPGICEAASLRLSIRQHVDFLIKQFKDTSTLDDQFGLKRTDELFDLGQLLVYVNWHRIDKVLKRASINKIRSRRG